MTKTIGTCSLCGGDVVMPTAWWSVITPKPTCSRCGAVAATSGPVIPMEMPARNQPAKKKEWYLEIPAAREYREYAGRVEAARRGRS